jgi:hypothetical protein
MAGSVAKEERRLQEKKALKDEFDELNEDRHLNNLGLICTGERFTPAPIFDQGLSLLTANQSVNWRLPMEENVRRVVVRPFSGSHGKMWKYFGEGFRVDVQAALEWLQTEPQSKEKEVLEYQVRILCFESDGA